jgi:glycosyltransferase involved in cell wall biosynthesis
VPDPGQATTPGRDVLYVGRLDAAKGVDLLLEAWRLGGRDSGRSLVVGGDGPMASLVEQAAAEDPTIRWRGRLEPAEVAEAMRDAAVLVVPSRFFEGYPLVVAEAFGHGRPVLTVAGGSVGTVVDDSTGWVVEPSVAGLTDALGSIDDAAAAERGRAARASYEENNSPERGLDSLLDVYAKVTR